ncbi:hypothetical protein [Chroogloeocystis siderophila]|jgi:hypothetical protein|uniref:Uncharacterized protein n=1 Tax=Chroogloeocystis siderophila 5.2 s.c.1 TaxID=247279 RepID=A0A1U7HDL6_9CHRO|nr:hypothetical protein [Chroogloeocystis siderophila]OKH21635.1 hypothetical protein NIES1031_21395 [Chroogloeocystis siderophila 5.2 s.c.1]
MSRFTHTLILRWGAGALFALALAPLLAETAAATVRTSTPELGLANSEVLYAQQKGAKGVKGQPTIPPKGVEPPPPKGVEPPPPKGVEPPPPKGVEPPPPKGVEPPPPKGVEPPPLPPTL